MTSTFFATNDGDIILRAGPEPDSKHDFRVHRFILSLASPVFKDMFAFPQPPDQTLHEQHQLPTVGVLDPPEVLDTILRLIYPGVEPPKIPGLRDLTSVLSTADKYNITSIYPILRDTLKAFLPIHSFRVYVIACRFGFPEEAKEAARVSSTGSIIAQIPDEEVKHISTIDLLRFVRFVQEREHEGRSMIQATFDWWGLLNNSDCTHWKDGKEFYFHLEKAVQDAFYLDPCVESKDLFPLLDKVPDPPPGCESLPKSGEYYQKTGDKEAFSCPLQPMTIRANLTEVASDLANLNRRLLEETFGEGARSD